MQAIFPSNIPVLKPTLNISVSVSVNVSKERYKKLVGVFGIEILFRNF
jgi:hypothetical protein